MIESTSNQIELNVEIPTFSALDLSENSVVYENNSNSYEPEQLQNLCTKLESLSKIKQVEVLRIFYEYNRDLINENKYGIHINITDVNDKTLNEVEQYMEYVEKQENELDKIETQQNKNETYILNDNKEISIDIE